MFIYVQDDWNPDWQSTTSSKVTYLVNKLKVLQKANEHIEEVNQTEELCSASNMSVNFYNGLAEKVIIFSQFLEHIHVIEQQV